MRARLLGFTGLFALLIGMTAMMFGGGLARAQDEATPAASPEAAAADEAAGTTGEEAAPNIVTLVAWYQPAAEGDLLDLVPLLTSPTYVANGGEITDQALTGTVNFAAERNAGGLPRITLGDSIFDAYPLVEGDRDSVQRWLYFDGTDGERPATLVMQITAERGPYDGASGTATFISRSGDSTGVLVIVLYLAS
jgi:hypothetical protein